MVKLTVIMLMVVSPTLLYGLFGADIAIIVNSFASIFINFGNLCMLIYTFYRMNDRVSYRDICPLLCGLIGITLFILLGYDWIISKTYIEHEVRNALMWSVAHSFFAYAFYLMIYDKYIKFVK